MSDEHIVTETVCDKRRALMSLDHEKQCNIMRGYVDSQINLIRTELKSDTRELREDIKKDIEGFKKDVKEDMTSVNEKLDSFKQWLLVTILGMFLTVVYSFARGG